MSKLKEVKRYGFVKRTKDRFMRHFKGKYEGKNRVAIDIINGLYLDHFDEIPEMLNLGENYENRKKINVASFNNAHWIKQFRIGYGLYQPLVDMIDIMCSYETARVFEQNSGYTDDPVHLLFFDVKLKIVKLGISRLETQDLEEISKLATLLK